MIRERSSSSDRHRGAVAPARREILCADLDHVRATDGLWTAPAFSPPSTLRDALHEAVREAVATALTPKQRDIIEAHFFEGRSQGDIARSLGVSQQVIHKHIYGSPRGGRLVGGALRKLKKALLPFLIAHPDAGRITPEIR
jgi:DNA-directed RNA polymerase specialized sigma24 family protein